MIGQTMAFPDVLRRVSTTQLLEVYEAGPARIRSVVSGLTPDELRAHPRRGKWGVAQIVAHVADAEVIGAGRFRLALAQPDTALVGYDQDVWASTFAYDEWSQARLRGMLHMFEFLRETTMDLLRHAASADWAKAAVHPEWGSITVRQLLELYADHSERHVEQILALRERLGKPMDVPLLLSQRLY